MKVWKIFRNIISSIIVFILINSMIVFSYASEQNTVDKKLEPNIEAKQDEEIRIENNKTRILEQELDYLVNMRVYIKNAYTGKYLDVAGGNIENGTNVQQYEFNGTNAQKWGLYSYGDGNYTIVSELNSDGTHYNRVLDVSNGLNGENINVHLWENNGNDAQKFSICKTNYSTYVIFSKVSNYEKCVQLDGFPCNNSANVDQYSWVATANQCWILEPVYETPSFGVRYAKDTYNLGVHAYPDMRDWGADCTNFVSQCLLASGKHYQDDWKVYRKNDAYSKPTSVQQLDESWELCQPKTSPWTSAQEFYNYWKNRSSYRYIKGSDIVANSSNAVLQTNLNEGDVIQYAEFNIFGQPSQVNHTMYVTGRNSNNYYLTYHSESRLDKSLVEICNDLPNKYFIFYRIM